MTTTISTAGSTSIPINSYSAIQGCQIETYNGVEDLGYVSAAGATVDYSLNVVTAGTYILSLGLASVSPASLAVLVNGSQVATFNVSGNAWETYQTLTQVITLPAGAVDLQIKSVVPTQYNIQTISLAPNVVTVAQLQAKIQQAITDLNTLIATAQKIIQDLS